MKKFIHGKTGQIFYKVTRQFLFSVIVLFLYSNISDSQEFGDTISFQRPMTLVTQDQINIVKNRIANQIEPQYSEYQKLIQDANDALSITPDVPSLIYIEGDDEEENITYWRHVVWSQTRPALASALAYVYSDNTDYADKALEIINAWAYEAPTISSTHGRHRDILAGQSFTHFVHIADLLWNYPGWSQEDKDKVIEYLLYINSRSTGYWRTNNIGDAAVLYRLALACLLQDEQMLEEVEYRVQNWLINWDPFYEVPMGKIVYDAEYDLEHLKRETDRERRGLSYSFVSGSAISVIAEMLRLLGWDIMEVPVPPDGATISGAFRQTAQWHMDYYSGVHSFPYYDPPEEIYTGSTRELIEYLNNYKRGEDTELQNWLVAKRSDLDMGRYYDPFVTLNRGDIPIVEFDQDLPETPILDSPENNETGISNPVTLVWNESEGTDFYELQIAPSSEFSPIIYENNEIENLSYKLHTLSYNTEYYWRVRAFNSNGSSNWSEIRSFTTDTSFLKSEQTIFLNEGWNTISSYIKPDETDINNIFAEIQDNVSIVRNNYGEVYWPEFNIDDIVTWYYSEGYQVNMKSPDTLILYGKQLMFETISLSLSEGWNIVPYVIDQPIPVEVAFESISSSLVLVTNNSGELYWPEYNINNVGYLQPGEGYKIFVTENSTFTYPSLEPSSINKRLDISQKLSNNKLQANSEIYRGKQINTGSNSFILVTSDRLRDGDKIGVWSENDVLIGNGVVENEIAAVTVWGRNTLDNYTDFGARDNEMLQLTIWSENRREEKSVTVESITCLVRGELDNSSIRYKENSVIIARIHDPYEFPKRYSLQQNYPNPFNPATTIEYTIPQTEKVTLEIYNVLGKRIDTLIDEKQVAGTHRLEFDASKLSSGVYFYRIRAGNFTETKRMILLR